MITKKEIKSKLETNLGNFLNQHGYKKKKVASDMITLFTNESENYNYAFSCSSVLYEVHRLIYGFAFGIKEVVLIQQEIDNHVPLARNKYIIQPYIMNISPGVLLDPFNIYKAYKDIDTEEKLVEVFNDIMNFYNSKFIPFCNQYSNYKNLDKEFNSFDNFYIKGNGIYPSLTFFHETRLIIARLANNPEYEKVVEKNFEALEYLWEQDGGKYDRFDETKPEVFAAKYLRDLKV